MKQILFHSNQLGLRGTEVALYDYAHYNETLLSNQSFICASKHGDIGAIKKFQKRFTDIFLYDTFSEVQAYVDVNKIEYAYFIKAGDNDGKVLKNCKNLIHAVFQHDQPHGDKYVYVSEWLAKKMGHPEDYIPHIVWLPEPISDYQEVLGIPNNAIVYGRYGGYNEFDIPFVHEAIWECVNRDKERYFLFMNTKPFCADHPQIIHVNSTTNLQGKSNFINTCDFMIHARYQGESFGLACAEFLFHGKPIITYSDSPDQHHYDMVSRTIKNLHRCHFYSTKADLKVFPEPCYKLGGPDVSICVKDFTPGIVMERFDKIFLQ